jgi:hypothetical protein
MFCAGENMPLSQLVALFAVGFKLLSAGVLEQVHLNVGGSSGLGLKCSCEVCG